MNKNKFLKKIKTNKEAIWIKCKLTNNEELYFPDYTGWTVIKNKCDKKSLFIQELELQFRSHCVTIDIEEAEAIYLVRSIIGNLSGGSKNYYTTGILKENKIYKKMWVLPELVVERETCESIDDCYEEALVYNGKKKKN